MRTSEECCTLYRFIVDGFERYIFRGVHWQEIKANNVLKSGLQNADSVVVYADFDSVSAVEPLTPGKDFLVKGEVDFEFDNSSQKTVSESMKQLRERCELHTISSVDRKPYGSKRLRHIKISAK